MEDMDTDIGGCTQTPQRWATGHPGDRPLVLRSQVPAADGRAGAGGARGVAALPLGAAGSPGEDEAGAGGPQTDPPVEPAASRQPGAHHLQDARSHLPLRQRHPDHL